MIKSIEAFYKDECFKRLKVRIGNNEGLSNQIDRFIKDWANLIKEKKYKP